MDANPSVVELLEMLKQVLDLKLLVSKFLWREFMCNDVVCDSFLRDVLIVCIELSGKESWTTALQFVSHRILFYLIVTSTLYLLIKIVSLCNINYELLTTAVDFSIAVVATARGHEKAAPHATRTLRPLQFKGRLHSLLQRNQ